MSFFDKLANWLELDDFDKRHKTAFIVLGCVTVLIFVLWFFQLQRNITNPLYGGLNPKQLKDSANQSTVSTAEDELKAKDTDTDGLSDWDELNIYKTSPYLADSDSDNINDYEEVQKGTDPNCPVGQDCSGISEGNGSVLENQNFNNILNQTSSDQTVTTQVAPVDQSTTSDNTLSAEEKNALKQIIGSSNDPALLRTFLLSSGADQAYVDSLKDDDLQKVINEILK